MALKDPRVYKKHTKPTYTNYGKRQRSTDDSSKSESEDDITITKVVSPSTVTKIYRTPIDDHDDDYDEGIDTEEQITETMNPVFQIPEKQATHRTTNEPTYPHTNEFPPPHII